MKAATQQVDAAERLQQISIHAAREGGDGNLLTAFSPFLTISIHAAREGGDYNVGDGLAERVISIHAAREGGDRRRVCSCLCR